MHLDASSFIIFMYLSLHYLYQINRTIPKQLVPCFLARSLDSLQFILFPSFWTIFRDSNYECHAKNLPLLESALGSCFENLNRHSPRVTIEGQMSNVAQIYHSICYLDLGLLFNRTFYFRFSMRHYIRPQLIL